MSSEHIVIIFEDPDFEDILQSNDDASECSKHQEMVVPAQQEISLAQSTVNKVNQTSKLSNIGSSSHQTPAFYCQYCSYITKTEYLLQKHVQTQHNPQREIFSCHLCSYNCLQERTFRLHQLKHTQPDAKFACDQCGKLFLSMGNMKRHALTHSKSKPFVCDKGGCGQSFNIKSRLTDHIRYVHKPVNGYSDNDIKNLELSSKRQSLSIKRCNEKDVNHTISSNISQEIFSSQMYCQETRNDTDPNVVTVYDIILSQDSQHSFELNNEIVDMNVSLPNSTSVEKNSTSVMPKNYLEDNSKRTLKFSCSWSGCGKKFRDGYNLRMHMCTHTGEMQRACRRCGYTCIQKSALDRHKRIHEGLKP